MPVQREDYTTDDEGSEHHPAFGIARIGRIHAAPGETLFQSDIRHEEYIEVTLSEASRKRNLKHDWVHAGRVVARFAMSMSQFASLVSSAGTEGVPVTITYDCGYGSRPGLNPESRLALTTGEVQAAAHAAFDHIKTAEAAYETALHGKAPDAERKQALSALRAAIANAAPDVDYAAGQLTVHAEAVVEKSRADIEAMISAARDRQLRAGIAGLHQGEPVPVTAGQDTTAVTEKENP